MATAKTKRFGVYLSEDGLSALNSIIALQQLNPDRDKSLVIDKALLFYHGYLSGQFELDYLCSTFGKKVDASVQQSQSRTATLIFKTAIELNMLTRLLAEDIHISNADYEKLRNRAVAAVKKTNGRIEMIDTINEELFNA